MIAYVYEQYPLEHWLIAFHNSRVLTATLFFTLNTEYGLRCTALDTKVKDVALSLWSCCIFPIFIKFIYNETCVKWPMNCVVSQGRWSFKKGNINLLRKMHMVDVVLCYVVVRHQPILPISFRVTSLALGQSYDCPSANETTLNDMGKSITSSRKGCYDYNKTKHNKIICILYGMYSGPWFNIKMSSYQYRKYHCGDKMGIRSSYHLHNGISYTSKITSLYWTNPLVTSYGIQHFSQDCFR